MVKNITQARPYAKAIFLLANKTNNYNKWGNYLKLLTCIVENNKSAKIINNPVISIKNKLDFILYVAGEHIGDYEKNLLELLLLYKKMLCIPLISTLYEAYKLKKDNIINVNVYTAFVLDQHMISQITSMLNNKLDQKINLMLNIKKELLAGFIIKYNNIVISYNVRNDILLLCNRLIGE